MNFETIFRRLNNSEEKFDGDECQWITEVLVFLQKTILDSENQMSFSERHRLLVQMEEVTRQSVKLDKQVCELYSMKIEEMRLQEKLKQAERQFREKEAENARIRMRQDMMMDQKKETARTIDHLKDYKRSETHPRMGISSLNQEPPEAATRIDVIPSVEVEYAPDLIIMENEPRKTRSRSIGRTVSKVVKKLRRSISRGRNSDFN